MSIKIDPVAVNGFAKEAAGRSTELSQLQVSIELPGDILGNFAEAKALVKGINLHTREVNQRLQATSGALLDLSLAAKQAATLIGASDDEITRRMKKINDHVDSARRKLITPTE